MSAVKGFIERKQNGWERFRLTCGASMTCMAMFGSGARIGTGITSRAP